MDAREWLSPVLRLRQELHQQPTEIQADLKLLTDVKVVVFDVYGTLVISGSGDVGSADMADHSDRMLQALESVGIVRSLSSLPTMAMLHGEIEQMNRSRRGEDCPKPEVDIVEVWRRILARCGLARGSQEIGRVIELAAQYEARANPTWPMPGSAELLVALQRSHFPMGIVSNAQVFTPLLVEDLLDSKKL